jgi:hypothetical protein
MKDYMNFDLTTQCTPTLLLLLIKTGLIAKVMLDYKSFMALAKVSGEVLIVVNLDYPYQEQPVFFKLLHQEHREHKQFHKLCNSDEEGNSSILASKYKTH